jgi:hypothetical protein
MSNLPLMWLPYRPESKGHLQPESGKAYLITVADIVATKHDKQGRVIELTHRKTVYPANYHVDDDGTAMWTDDYGNEISVASGESIIGFMEWPEPMGVSA